MEDKVKRLKRFQENHPSEIIETLLNSIDNHFNSNIEQAFQNKSWFLLILGIHAVALTISEGLFLKSGFDGFRLFLIQFIDEKKEGFDFSEIAWEIHNYRNVVAHTWLSETGYDFGLDFEQERGWEKRDSVIFFNPIKYYEAYKKAFSSGGRIWKYERILKEDGQEKAKKQLLKKYEKGSSSELLEETKGDRVTARGLLTYAEAYYRSFDEIKGSKFTPASFYPASYYLATHSIELSLKAVLRHHGYTLDILQYKYGHDLALMVKEVKKHSYIEITDKEETLIKNINYYYKEKLFEYIERGAKELPEETELDNVALLIKQKTEVLIKGSFFP